MKFHKHLTIILRDLRHKLDEIKVEEAVPAPYTAYCDAHKSTAHCVALEAQREKIRKKAQQAQGKRSIIPAGIKSVPAIHLSNLTSVFPVFGVDVHDLSKRSFTYDPKNERTI